MARDKKDRRAWVALNARELRMIAHHMEERPAMWDTPSDWVHDAIRIFHVILGAKAIEDLIEKALREDPDDRKHREGEGHPGP